MSVPSLHIAFGVDASYVPPMAATMLSLVERNSGIVFVFHVMASGFTAANSAELGQFATQNDLNIQIYPVDSADFSGLPIGNLSGAIYNRLKICDKLKGVAQRVLYLDSDIICLGDVSELVSLNLGDCIVAAAPDVEQTSRKQAIGLPQNHAYFNSGVILIDVDQWNANNISTVIAQTLADKSRRFPKHDQDALNIALMGKTFILPQKWNLLFDHFDVDSETVFLHYAGGKPWHRWSKTYGDGFFAPYLARTPWADWEFLPQSRKHKNKYAQYLLSRGRLVDGIYWYIDFLRTKGNGEK